MLLGYGISLLGYHSNFDYYFLAPTVSNANFSCWFFFTLRKYYEIYIEGKCKLAYSKPFPIYSVFNSCL